MFVQDRSVRRVRTKGRGRCLDLRRTGSRVVLCLGLFAVSIIGNVWVEYVMDSVLQVVCSSGQRFSGGKNYLALRKV